MQLLGNSFDDLSRTLMANRAMRQRAQENQDTLGLHREELDLRRGDQSDARAIRREDLAETTRHHGALENFQKAAAAAAKEENAAKRDEAMFKLLTTMGKEGMLTDDALRAMEDKFGEKFGAAGIGVKLFKLPPATAGEPQYFTDPVTGQRKAVLGKTMQGSGSVGGDVTYRPDPSDPEGPLVPTYRRRMTPEDFKMLDERSKPKPPPPAAPPPAPGMIDRIKKLLGGSGTGGMDQPVDTSAPAPGLPQGPTLPTEQDFLTNQVPAKLYNKLVGGAPTNAPAKPPGKTDQQILAEAGAAIRTKPEARPEIERRLRAWGMNPDQIP